MAFVHYVVEQARERLVMMNEAADILDVARHLHAGTDMVVLHDGRNCLSGILTKTDLVERLAQGEHLHTHAPVFTVMRREVVTCRESDDLRALWSLMQERGLKNLPLVDGADHPVGVLNARDALECLLRETENEEGLLRDYIMGFGYR